MKKCSSCNESKNLEFFSKDKTSSNGYKSRCKSCCNKNHTIWRNSGGQEWIREYDKFYFQNSDSKKNAQLSWRNKNKTYGKYRYKNDINFRLSCIIRTYLKRCYNNKISKNAKTFDILKYTTTQLKQRIEINFNKDMNWDNYGILWEIDHKIPINYFLKKGENRPQIINALSNLQPLLIPENRRKGSKFIKVK